MERGDTTTDDIARAHEIVAEEVRRWVVRRRSRRARPVDPSASGHAATRPCGRSSPATPAGCATSPPSERHAVEALARGVAAKLLHDPIVELKERSEPGADDLHAKLLIELLRLDPDDE